MNDKEIKNLWKIQNEKLDSILKLNHTIADELTKTKAKRTLSKLKPVKYLGLIIGLPWILFLYALVFVGISAGAIFFPISMGIIALTVNIAAVIYIYHLILLYQIDRTDAVFSVQKKLASIRKSDLLGVKVALIQIPFWSIFWLEVYPNFTFLAIHIVIFIAFGIATVWLISNIKQENMDKKWMKLIFSGSEWDSIARAEEMLEQVHEYRN